jgi:hypothetical protein
VADFHDYRSLALNDDQLLDMVKAREGHDVDLPNYPPGMRFTIRECCFDRLGIGEVKPGATIRFAAMAKVISVNLSTDGCRVELEFVMLKLGDGDFAELDEMARPSICLDENDHERLDLDEDTAQTGHLVHIVGEARVVGVDDNRYAGKSVTLQAESGLVVEDESSEDEDE